MLTMSSAKKIPSTTRIISGETSYNAEAITKKVDILISKFKDLGVVKVGLYLDNSPQWLFVSLAALFSNISIIPLPIFFSAQQLAHIISHTQMDNIIGPNPDILKQFMPDGTVSELEDNLFIITSEKNRSLNAGNKFHGIITFTSGTTGTPKGVLLPNENLYRQMESIHKHLNLQHTLKYLVNSPLSILLENTVCAAVLLHGGEVFINPIAFFIDIKTFNLNAKAMIQEVNKNGINILALNPYFLEQLIGEISQKTCPFPSSLKFISVGSAVTPINLLKQAQSLGLPVFEGYGTSETTSVISMNTAENNCIGSVGKLLPHVQIKIDEQGSILVKGNLFLGYLDGPMISPDEFYNTGDIGFLKNGYLYITGRQRNIMALRNGRKISPEWLEKEILQIPSVNHVVIIAEGRPFVTTIISTKENFNQEEFRKELAALNKHLPVYAKIHNFIVADEAFTRANGLLDAKFKPISKVICEKYAKEIESLYAHQKK